MAVWAVDIWTLGVAASTAAVETDERRAVAVMSLAVIVLVSSIVAAGIAVSMHRAWRRRYGLDLKEGVGAGADGGPVNEAQTVNAWEEAGRRAIPQSGDIIDNEWDVDDPDRSDEW